jgi:SNF family Na+-dependent transporter
MLVSQDPADLREIQPAGAGAAADGERVVEVVREEPGAKLPPPPPPAVPPPEFLSAESFAGSKPGYVFKAGASGLGYYRDRAHTTYAGSAAHARDVAKSAASSAGGQVLGGAADFSLTGEAGAGRGVPPVDLDFDETMCSAKVGKLIKDRSFFEPKADTQVWTSRLSYTLAAVGSAVGLGNIWRFPYLCYRNGGATFLIPYFISLFGLGIPLFALEFTLGQGTGKGALGAFMSLDRRAGGLGILTFLSTSGIVVYYCVILAWCMKYFLSVLGSLGSPLGLPWATGQAATFYQEEVLHKRFVCRNTTLPPPPDKSLPPFSNTGFWGPCPWPESVMMLTPESRIWSYNESVSALAAGCKCRGMGFENQSGVHMDLVLNLALVYLIVFGMCCAGTKSLKYAVYISVPLPFVLLFCLFVRGVTLPGASIGIEYYLKPDMNRLFNDYKDPVTGEISSASEVWLSAASQVFFSLSLSEGVMITYASYNPPSFPIVSNVLLVSAVNSGTELFAGFCVFSILGYLANYRGVPIQEVVKGGPGLVFEVIPEAIALMPSKGVFAFLFFFM